MHTICQLFLTFAHSVHTSLDPGRPGTPEPRVRASPPANRGIKFKAYDDSFRICRPCVGACSRRAPAEGASTCVREKSLVHLRPKLSSPSRGRRRIGPRIPRWGGQSLAVVSSAR